jgi:hypothetical protein
MRWVRRSKFRLESLRGRDLGIDGKIILKLILGKWDGECGLNSSDSGWGLMAGSCEHGNEPCDSIKCSEFLDFLLIKDSALWNFF